MHGSDDETMIDSESPTLPGVPPPTDKNRLEDLSSSDFDLLIELLGRLEQRITDLEQRLRALSGD